MNTLNFQWNESYRGRDCLHDSHWYGRIIQANGISQVVAVCSRCTAVSKAINHQEFRAAVCRNVEALPVFRDRRTDEPCARCGSQDGVELHHWAPRARFSDAWNWPTSFLCVPCHQRWHAVMGGQG